MKKSVLIVVGIVLLAVGFFIFTGNGPCGTPDVPSTDTTVVDSVAVDSVAVDTVTVDSVD